MVLERLTLRRSEHYSVGARFPRHRRRTPRAAREKTRPRAAREAPARRCRAAPHRLRTDADKRNEFGRKTATVAYEVVATLPGEADNTHDVTATSATMYTYRVRSKKAAACSEYSNEMSASPK